MTSHSNSNHRSSTSNKVVKTMKKTLYIILFLVVLFIAGFIYWNYYYTFSDGSRAGLLQKFSRKGNVFKTYEGEMILSSVQSTSNVPLASEKFFFSVANKDVAQKLSDLQGEFIVVYYNEKKGTLPWRGESTYMVDSVAVRDRQ
ncbi:MAG TPA: hypothetical protein VFG54_01690 [Prolixibacteraceae bacterium]|nr:hypothetical protein [Prolixibacteraceae bacterium]